MAPLTRPEQVALASDFTFGDFARATANALLYIFQGDK